MRRWVVNFVKRWLLETAAEWEFDDFKTTRPREFSKWSAYVTDHGLPEGLSPEDQVIGRVYLRRLGVEQPQPVRERNGTGLYRQ